MKYKFPNTTLMQYNIVTLNNSQGLSLLIQRIKFLSEKKPKVLRAAISVAELMIKWPYISHLPSLDVTYWNKKIHPYFE